ncbi:hypothetical protein ACJ73_02130 [Blastomyces percursus]|uniref:BTB domain-containing protein n=1 Tax=Blastomyces percursus TaxID=1658174 RepID=A0A1J9QEE9_9EURO|nr:hypothetical protein ACJ73_02130 [Blastomyces percursus]
MPAASESSFIPRYPPMISRKYSDLTICCGTNRYHVHRVVVCNQSPFFAAALDKQFKEATTADVVLEEDDPELVRRMIAHFYGVEDPAEIDILRTERPEVNDDSPIVSAAEAMSATTKQPYEALLKARLYAMGDKYGIEGLRACSRAEFDSWAANVDVIEDIDEFPAIVDEVFRSTPSNDRGLRDIAVSLLVDNAKAALNSQELCDVLLQLPELLMEIMKRVVAANTDLSKRLRTTTSEGKKEGAKFQKYVGDVDASMIELETSALALVKKTAKLSQKVRKISNRSSEFWLNALDRTLFILLGHWLAMQFTFAVSRYPQMQIDRHVIASCNFLPCSFLAATATATYLPFTQHRPLHRVCSIPNSIPICDFIFDEKYIDDRRLPALEAPSSGEYRARDIRRCRCRNALITSPEALGKSSDGIPTGIDYLPLGWAVHKLSGVATLINAASTADELAYQLRASKSSALFTCIPLLSTALEAASKCGIPHSRVYLLEMPQELLGGLRAPAEFTAVNQLIEKGSKLRELDALQWHKGQGASQCAYLCFSSGTSGLPKGVMISHRNMISEVLSLKSFENHTRTADQKDVVLGLLPQAHIFGLSPCRINVLYLVPPIIVSMVQNEKLMIWEALQPSWPILQAYGLTETTAVATTTSPHDIFFGSSGSLLLSLEARLISPDGDEIEEYDTPGELLVRGPTIVLGYLNNEEANKATSQDGWLWTGDEAVLKKSPKGKDPIFIVDRIKELIKVKGFQVAPDELEAHLLTHPHVADTAVIAVIDDAAGEVPKAYVVKANNAPADDQVLIRDIKKHVSDHKAHYKWLKGGGC